MSEALRVGLVGAGPWAGMVHAPVLAAGPETALAGVWARRPEAAAELAGRYGAPVFEQPDDLYAACDAVAFAVPPDVQATMAIDAARAGKHLLLEKPIAADLDAAIRLAEAVDAAGVASMVVLSWRYSQAVRDFLDAAAAFDAIGGTGRFISGALLGGPFATPWRLERGALLDVGPHVLDLLDAAIGPIVDIRAHGNRHGWIGLQCTHSGGASSDVSLCVTVPVAPHQAGVALYGPGGTIDIDCAAAVGVDAFATLRREFAAAVTAGRHPLDVHRGLHLQRLLDAAERQLLGG